MNLRFFGKKFKCEKCNSKFSEYDELISHTRHVHNHTIVKCEQCGKEFVHEKDRLHHARKEHEEKMAGRLHKSEHKHEKSTPSPQDEVDAHTRNFSDNL